MEFNIYVKFPIGVYIYNQIIKLQAIYIYIYIYIYIRLIRYRCYLPHPH